MIGKPESSSFCGFCGGNAQEGRATVPFVLGKTIVVVRDVPARVCQDCGEPFMNGRTVDIVTKILTRLQNLGAEVSVVSYIEEEDGALLPH